MCKSKAMGDTVTDEPHPHYIPDGIPSTAWLLSHPKIRAMLGGCPDDYIYQVEVTAPLPSKFDLSLASPLMIPPLEPLSIDIFIADYISNVFPYFPLVGLDVLLRYQRDVLRDGLQSTIESAICLCISALAAIATSQSGVPLNGQFDHVGSIFVSPALKIMMNISTLCIQPRVELSEAWTLAAVWFAYLGRPLQSWKCISQAATNLQHLFHG